MANVVIIGAQWGDEGKGKVVDIYTEHAHQVVRYQGGNTAGKEVYVHGLQFWGEGGPTGGAPETSPDPDDDGHTWPVANFDNSSQTIIAGEKAGACDAFFRFPDVVIPVGSTINSAKLRLYIVAVDNPTLLKVFAEDAANPAVVTTRADHAGRARTTQGVDWDLVANPATWELSPECAAVIQELVDSYDYSAGAAITIFLDDDGSANDQMIDFYGINKIPQGLYAPQLILDHTPPVTWDLTISSSADGSCTTPGEGVFADYADAQVVPIIATPDPGKVFENWSGDTGDIANVNSSNTTITMNADYTIVANFGDPVPSYGVSGPGAGPMMFKTVTGMQ